MAVLGTFQLSILAYGLPHAAFFNLRSPETNNAVDWTVAILGEVFLDQKAVALIAIVFGASIVQLKERFDTADEKPVLPVLPVLRRSALLFAVGMPVGMHGLLWEGTTLWFMAFVSPLLLVVRRRRPRTLIIVGALFVLLSPVLAVDLQSFALEPEETLDQYWVTGTHGVGDAAGTYMALGTFTRIIGALMIGVACGRLGILESRLPSERYRSMVRYGLPFGIVLSAASVLWRVLGDFGDEVAIIGEIPNTIGAVPMAFGYIGLAFAWLKSGRATSVSQRIRAVGRMALTCSALFTAFGILIVREGFIGRGRLDRTSLALVAIAACALLADASHRWLTRFTDGPLEWAVRALSGRSRGPLRRTREMLVQQS